ncbi:malate:quinone oxidoreductase [Paraburkholderia sp. ZP32-5]|uniref:malate:quinone oxidoreductase n=1 Tax=Paraburkholderia sp. ZP32-5 TaxID=2883245 RepID=UPI001F33FDD2|nr:malate:quinone oxidoreductase [Paraburkholderia sp. ZP32-5]
MIIDKRTELGAGKLGEYVNVTGNTVGNTFLACLEHENFQEVFADLRQNSPLHKRMIEAADGPPSLADAGALLAQATEQLLAYLSARYNVTVLRGHEIDKIRRLESGGFEIVYHDVNDPTSVSTVSSDTVVMNLGGQQRVGEIDQLCRGLRLPPLNAGTRSYVSDDVLSLTTAQLIAEFKRDFSQRETRRPNRLTVIGGSHSAFTVVDRLAMELGNEGLDEIAVIHRSQVRLFFETVEEARADGYEVDEVNDVCPVTKRVNRAGGLRYRAFDIARSIMASGHIPAAKPRVELIAAYSSEAARSRAREYLRDSIAVIHGAGYGPNMSTLVDHYDRPISLQLGQGGVVSDKYGCPFDASGKAVRGLFSFGLGSGFRPDEQIRRETGFEAAFRGRIYGVWAFHHDFGGRVMNGVLEALATVPFAHEADVASHESAAGSHALPELSAYDGPNLAMAPQS